MNNTNTGGPAFPTYQSDHQGKAANTTFEPKGGITLRDYFAAKAMQALLAQNFGGAVRDEMVAGFAYAMADAMLKARQA